MAVLAIALTKVYFIDKNAEQPAPIPAPKPAEPVVPFGEYPGSVSKAAYRGTIQVNKLPFPFNLDGTMPYQVWVDGERVPINSKQANTIIDALDLAKGPKFIQPEDTAEIHSGAGWQFPLPPSVQ